MNAIKDYFGFDLGDGESAVAWLREGSSAPPMQLEIAGRKNALTALGESESGKTLIGEQALMLDAQKLHVRFKSRYLIEKPHAGRLIRLFAARVLEEIAKTGKLENPSEAAFFVGCPSGWDAATREEYRRLFEEAGFPNVCVVSESRAAFLFARESGELGLPDEALNQPALVIDAGSSTTDFTFIHELCARPAFDFGLNALGGGLIDQGLLKRNVQRHPARARIEQIFEACPQYQARCELEARKVKEMYFLRLMQREGELHPMGSESSVKLYYDDPPLTLDISCDDKDMREILSAPLMELDGLSWLDAYRTALDRARGSLSAAPPEIIMLTGGASRMGFIKELAREAFPKARLVQGAEPEFAIARGLAYALRVDTRTARFEDDIRALIESDAVEEIVKAALPSLMRALAPAIADELVERAAPAAFSAWRAGEVRTIGDMSTAMREGLMMSLEGGALKRALEGVTANWIEEVRPLLEDETDPICARCCLPPATLRLPSSAPDAVSGLNLSGVTLIDLTLIQTVLDLVVASVVAALLGGSGVALLMAGPVGLIVSFMIGFIASRLGTTLARQHMDKFVLPAFMRMLFSRRMFEKMLLDRKSAIENSVLVQLKGRLDESEEAAKAMVDGVSGAIEGQLTEMAERARLMIH